MNDGLGERYEVIRQELGRLMQELDRETLSDERRRELSTERERLECEFVDLARRGLLSPPPAFTA